MKLCERQYILRLNLSTVVLTPIPWSRRRSAAARLLRMWVRIPPGVWIVSVVSVVCCQAEVSATS